MKIFFLGTQMAVGGAQLVLLNQAEWFFNKGYDVTAAFLYDKENLKEKWESQYPFPVIDLQTRQLGANPAKKPYLLLGGMLRLWRLIRKNKFDLIETFTPDSNLLGLFISRLTGVPVRIGSHHGYIEGVSRWQSRLHGWMINNGFAHILVAVSKQVYRLAIEVENVRPDRMVVIQNGVDPVKFRKKPSKELISLQEELGLSADDFVYLSVGRITTQKGHSYLLDAIPKVLERFPENTAFIIAGEGYLRESLESKAQRLGITKAVHCLGNRSDILDLLSLANVFVMPSLSEGLPLALLEAMSTGLPVVASRVGGIEVVIKHGVNGYLFPPKDVEALSLALIKIRDDRTARKKIADNNTIKINEEYTIDKMCAQYEDLFLRLYHQERSTR